MDRNRFRWFFLMILLVSILSGCSSSTGPEDAVMSYYQALAAKDSDQLSLLSCADWESQAQVDLQSFGAVTVLLEDFSCQQTGEEGEFTLVSCTGKMIANYGNEVMEIDLSNRTYLVTEEGGEWRMCGYR